MNLHDSGKKKINKIEKHREPNEKTKWKWCEKEWNGALSYVIMDKSIEI